MESVFTWNMRDYVREFLRKRGYTTPEEQEAFLHFQESSLRKAADMVNGPELLEKLAAAVREKKHICVYGDYDADGIMAAFILYSGLDHLCGSGVHWFINDRFEDGYNISPESMAKLLQKYPDTEVVLTCDNGVSAAQAIDFAMEQGVAVLVTDHHEQGLAIREDCPVVDEKSLAQKAADRAAETADPGSEKKGAGRSIREDFCGAELARRVITELYERCGAAEENRDFLEDLYAYAGFATITDSVPMNAANHFVAKKGLEIIRKREGFWKLLEEVCGNRTRGISGETIGFSYGPMINAGGRVTGSAEHAFHSLQYFYEGRENDCRQALQSLAALNETRKELCSRDGESARRLIEQEQRQDDAFLLLYGEQFSEGVNGLTAGRLAEKYQVPAAVLSPTKKDPSLFKGSARSVEGFDLFAMLSSHPEKITAGGHPMAAGLSVKKEDLETVRELLIKDAEKRREEIAAEEAEAAGKAAADETAAGGRPAKKGPADHLSFDFHFMERDLTLETVRVLQEAETALEPFGPGLEPFRIALQGPAGRLYGMRGKDGQERHAKFIMDRSSADGSRIEALWWNHIKEARGRMETAREFFFIGRPEIHEYNGVRSVQFIIGELYSR